MVMSVNTNTGAMIALQNLSKTQSGLETVQSRINTGLSVSGAKDDSATFSIAQKLRSELGGLKAVASSLNRAKSTVDVALSGAESISDVLNQMKAKALAAADVGLDSDSRASLNADFKALRDQITTVVSSASFNGTNLLDPSGSTVQALMSTQSAAGASPWAADSLTIANQDLSLGGANISVGATDEINTAAAAATAVQNIEDSITAVNNRLGDLGSGARRIDAQLTFNNKLSDTIEAGIGNLVDADLAKESANLQALQIKQQLGLQALSIANQSPQSVLSLFQ